MSCCACSLGSALQQKLVRLCLPAAMRRMGQQRGGRHALDATHGRADSVVTCICMSFSFSSPQPRNRWTINGFCTSQRTLSRDGDNAQERVVCKGRYDLHQIRDDWSDCCQVILASAGMAGKTHTNRPASCQLLYQPTYFTRCTSALARWPSLELGIKHLVRAWQSPLLLATSQRGSCCDCKQEVEPFPH